MTRWVVDSVHGADSLFWPPPEKHEVEGEALI
jgi:hypothetical protein